MTTIKLPYIRYVRQVSNGASRSKYAYLAMMRENAAALETAPWALAKSATPTLTVNQLTRSDGVYNPDTGEYTKEPTYTAYFDDHYDCFCQAGDAVKTNATMCGYAGIVAYRFTLPTVNPGAIDNIALRIQRDRYLRSGVRAVAAFSNSETPSDDWSVIRGTATGSIVSTSTAGTPESGVESYGFLGQPTISYLLAGRADEGTLIFDAEHFAALAGAASYTYLYVYLSPEDLAGYWQWYEDDVQRSYYIEGSAMLVPSDTSFTFVTAAVPPTTARTYELVKNGVVPSFGATDTLSPVLQVTVQKNGDPINYNSIKQLAATVAGNGGHVNGTKVDVPVTTNNRQYAIIYGYGFKGTWPDIPGLVVYDVLNKELLYTDVAAGIDQAMSQMLKDGVYGVLDVIYTTGRICPLFYQIGHTNPTPVLDGTLCYLGQNAICCFYFSVSEGNITTDASTIYSEEANVELGTFYSPVCAWDSTTSQCYQQAEFVFIKDGFIKTTRSSSTYPFFSPKVPYVGTIRGIVPIEFDGNNTGTNRVAWKVFIWGDLTSINGTPCSKCAILTMCRPSSGDPAQDNPMYAIVEVPEIDSDLNWPSLSSDWSIQPQVSTVYEGQRLFADTNSFLLCGATDHSVRRWITGVWYKTQYDDMLVAGREMPQTGVIGNAEGYGGFFPATIASESVSIPLTDGAAGLRALYGRFRAFGLTAVPNYTQQIGAAFSVSWKECQLKSSGVKIGSWQIAASALVVPFGCPAWEANQISFDWTGWTGTRTSGVRFHVWLARNTYTVAPQAITAAACWGNGSASGLEYVGEINPTGESTTATLTLARPLTCGYATLIVTAYVSMDNVNPSDLPTLPQGASSLEVNMADASVENGDTAFLPEIALH